MSRKFLTAIDLTQLELLNTRIQNLASAPGTPVIGQIYFDTTLNKFRVYAGAPISNWVNLDGSDIPDGTITSAKILDGAILNADINAAANIALSKLATDPLARANHTGTQLASTISDFNTAVRLNRVDQLATAGADVAFGGFKLTGVATPIAGTDAANKAYVDTAASGLDVKASVRVATTAAGTLASSFANGSIVDGVTLATGDRILIKDQAAGDTNGIYTVNASGAPTRAADADTNAEVTSGMFTFVSEGTVNGDSGWVLTTNDPITLGTTPLVFAQFSSAGTVLGGAGLLKTGNTIDAVAGTTPATVAGPGGGLKMNADDMVIDATIVSRKYTTTVGDGAALAYVKTHSLSNQWVTAQVYRNSAPFDLVDCEIELTDANNVTLRFAIAPSAAQYRVIVTG
jgi:hypothetical protein